MKTIKTIIIALLAVVCVASCQQKKNPGFYVTELGFEAVMEDGNSLNYEYREDGIYLFKDEESLYPPFHFKFKEETYLYTRQRTGDTAFMTFDFLRKDENGKFVYFLPWDKIEPYFDRVDEVQFGPNGGFMFIVKKDGPQKGLFKLLEMYLSRSR